MNPRDDSMLHLTTDQTAQLLHAGLSQAMRPIDMLVDRLSDEDGAAWLEQSLRAILTDSELRLLQDNGVTIAEIAAIKLRAKQRAAGAPNHQEHLAAIACYCLAVARGLLSCDQLLSSRSGEEWAELFAGLAGDLPEPWRDMVSRAAERALNVEQNHGDPVISQQRRVRA